MTTQAVFDAFLGEPAAGRTFFHGHTYTGNPLACAAALANLDLMGKRDTLEGVRERGEVLAAELAPLAGHPHVGDIRRRGLMAGIELVADKTSRSSYGAGETMGARVAAAAREAGAVIRPLGDVVVLMPPLAIPIPELRRLASITRGAIDAATGCD
jgi:adenosylmethionine-8-amino-7-oxononanoate aminotransferase